MEISSQITWKNASLYRCVTDIYFIIMYVHVQSRKSQSISQKSNLKKHKSGTQILKQLQLVVPLLFLTVRTCAAARAWKKYTFQCKTLNQGRSISEIKKLSLCLNNNHKSACYNPFLCMNDPVSNLLASQGGASAPLPWSPANEQLRGDQL